MRDTIDMAREAGFKEHSGMVYTKTIFDDCSSQLKAFEALVRADAIAGEREACAKVCEGFADGNKWSDAHGCAATIRERSANAGARGETK